MSPSEIAFLAVGLVFGAAVGGAIAQALRSRPAPRREVRLTIAPNAIPIGRTRTLAIPPGSPYPGVVPGSPDGEALEEAALAVIARPAAVAPGGPSSPQARTRVPTAGVVLPATAVGVPVSTSARTAVAVAPPAHPAPPALIRPDGGGFTASARPAVDAPGATAVELASAAAVIAVLDLPAPGAATFPRGDEFATLVRPRPPADAPRPALPMRAVAVAGPAPTRPALPAVRLAPPSGPTLTRPPAAAAARLAGSRARAKAGDPVAGDPGAPGGPADGPSQLSDPSSPCAGTRRLVDERCALAGVARDQAKAAADALHEARRAYDVLREGVDRAAATADPRRMAGEKDRLHAAFRAASDTAAGPEETEAAARGWLDDINALNASVREATRVRDAGGAELQAALPALERRAAEADAARIAAENAEAGCNEAREDLARCEEAELAARRAVPPAEEPRAFDDAWPSETPDLVEPEPVDLLSGMPAIMRILRGDREARERLVAGLAGQDGDSARDWQLRVSRLVDAINGRAIEDGYLDLPTDDPFWRLFEYRESRDIVGALSALGFRYDGLGGFADGRVPAARDLSLAVGYAGLDRMRIRTWPREAELATLYARATVAGDEWLANQAGDLSLGRMVDALGGRAAELADLWNAWGRVRPALLAE